jgi:hypothetical protein
MGKHLPVPLVAGSHRFYTDRSLSGELAVARSAARAGLPYALSNFRDTLNRKRSLRPEMVTSGSSLRVEGPWDWSMRCSTEPPPLGTPRSGHR